MNIDRATALVLGLAVLIALGWKLCQTVSAPTEYTVSALYSCQEVSPQGASLEVVLPGQSSEFEELQADPSVTCKQLGFVLQ